jgi:hypothetical protein
VQGVELHAHHVKPYNEHPELRWDVSNGLTVCHSCHWNIHSGSEEGPEGKGSGNPEGTNRRKPIEGVTTRGRAYRRWEGSCEWCGAFISKRWSDTVGKAHLFCGRHCAGKHKAAHRTYRRWKEAPLPRR